MFEKLHGVERRFAQINHLLQQPEVAGDAAKYQQLMKEYHDLEPLVEAYSAYTQAEKDYTEAKELMESGGLEPDFKEIVQQQFCENRQKLEELEQKIKILLLPKDANDDKNIIMEIRAGTGGEEAALFARSLCRMYQMYAQKSGFRCQVLSSNDTELGGVKEICFSVEGAGAYSRLKYESGTHRVQRVPETESQGRIQTSAVTVAVLPEAEEVDFQLDMKDLRIDPFRASGAGGQHINKTSSAIRVTHLPTGTVVECQNERSQIKNRESAMQVLKARLYDHYRSLQESEYAENRRLQVGTGDRSERIRTYNYPQGRVTDHRIGMTLYSLDAFLDGDIGEMIEALREADQTARLNNEN